MNKETNDLFLYGLINNDYRSIYDAIQKGAPKHDKTKTTHSLFLKNWQHIVKLNDIGIIELLYAQYLYKESHHLDHLLTSIIQNKKECFDFFFNQCIKTGANLNRNYSIILSNACRVSPLSTYFDEDSYSHKYTSDYYLEKLLQQNIQFNTTTHPLVILSKNNNFHSWKLLYEWIKNKQQIPNESELIKISVTHSLFNFLNNNSFQSDEIQYFFSEFDKKHIYSCCLKKISHPSYQGEELEHFCTQMFLEEPELFLKKSKTLGINNDFFKNTIKKIVLFDKINKKSQQFLPLNVKKPLKI